MMYWTDLYSLRPAIYRSTLINPVREIIVSGCLFSYSLSAPTTLAIDFTGKK